MNNKILIGMTLALLLVLSACSSGQDNTSTSQKVLGSAYIAIDDVTIDVMEVSRIPTELKQGGSIQFFGGGTHLIDFQISGNPPDHYPGSHIFSLVELYDDASRRCDMNILSGITDDALVMDKIDVVAYVKCSDTKSIKFIFGTSSNEYLTSAGDKFTIPVQDTLSDKLASLLKSANQKNSASASAYRASVASGKSDLQAQIDGAMAQTTQNMNA